ncbi:MAG: hypothetical protein RI947_964 [Candidatus Parcubacteria bacterium]|jgi:glucosamine--fructose-6-phosphate aminotransferase (isomerizing)
MCGIYGYIGNKNASEVIIDGLKRLDYRGYDSWGVALQNSSVIKIVKETGRLNGNIDSTLFPKSNIGIGHTRWATHGSVTQLNAHPHYSTDQSFTLAQNGIVENYQELKQQLSEKGYAFISETDTEVIVRLVEEKMKTTPDLITAIRQAFLDLKGRNTIIVLTNNDEIIAARNGSPLVVGVNETNNEIYLSSDTLSFAPYVEKMVVIDNGQMVHCVNNTVKLFDIESFKEVPYSLEAVHIKSNKVDKEGHEHFMLKEIYDTPVSLINLAKQDKASYVQLAQAIKSANKVYTIGSGTAGIAAAQTAFYLREYASINAVSLIGADAQEYYHLFTDKDLIIAPSQSGETADVLEVLEIAKKKGMKIASLVNMVGSMMTRMSDYAFMADAGPEICVMSTKVFTSQIAWGYLVSKAVTDQFEEGVQNLKNLSHMMQEYLVDQSNHHELQQLAHMLMHADDIFLMGKYQNFQIMKEGMVKLIEGTYKHAHAIPAGDLKHYAITLMEQGVPVIVTLSNDKAHADMINAINQVKAREAQVIGISPVNHEKFDFHIQVADAGETSAILNIIPLQLLAYYLAKELGNNIDKPRNIAKSVTVK